MTNLRTVGAAGGELGLAGAEGVARLGTGGTSDRSGPRHDHAAALAARPLMFASSGLAGLARMLSLEPAEAQPEPQQAQQRPQRQHAEGERPAGRLEVVDPARARIDAEELFRALDDFGSDEDAIFRVLEGASPAELLAIERAFVEVADGEWPSLVAALKDDLSGSELQRALRALERGNEALGPSRPGDLVQGRAKADATAQKIRDLLDGDFGVERRTTRNGTVTTRDTKRVARRVIEILKAECKGAGELDAVVSRLGRTTLIERLGGADGELVARHIDAVRAKDAKPGDWEGFERYLDAATGTRASRGNRVTLLTDGAEAFPAIFDAIDGATSSIHVETFEFFDDQTGNAYADKLIAAARRGVDVKVLLDRTGSGDSADVIAAKLRAGGVHVSITETDMLMTTIDHRKIVVVDGRTGFTGGMNIGDAYHNEWRDTHSRIEGPGVTELQRIFLERWRAEGNAVAEGIDYFPEQEPLAEDQDVRFVPHTGFADEHIRHTYLRAIDTAEKSIVISSPYFTDREVFEHLKAAAQRGVEVHLMWPRLNDQELLKIGGRARYEELIAAGCKVYEYDNRMNHGKVMVVDSTFATVGSSNLDARSLRNNHEINAVSLDPTFARHLESQLLRDLAESAVTCDRDPGEGLRHAVLSLLTRIDMLEDQL